MLIRYYAAAMEASGLEEEQVAVDTSATATDLRAALVAAHPGLERVLPQCSLLVDGAAVTHDGTVVGGAHSADVLPPFAGG